MSKGYGFEGSARNGNQWSRPVCIALLTQGHNAARDGARAVLGINQDLNRLVQPCWTARRRRVNDRIAELEIRGVLEGQIARGEDAKVAVHPSMASRATAMVPKAIAMRLENSVSTVRSCDAGPGLRRPAGHTAPAAAGRPSPACMRS